MRNIKVYISVEIWPSCVVLYIIYLYFSVSVIDNFYIKLKVEKIDFNNELTREKGWLRQRCLPIVLYELMYHWRSLSQFLKSPRADFVVNS